MHENIMKPATIMRQEFIEDITALINGSNLPAFIIEPILKDLYLETKASAEIQYKKDKEHYEKALAEQEKK